MAGAIHLSEAQRKFAHEWQELHIYLGMEKASAQAMATLFLLQEPVSTHDLAEHLGVSGQKLRGVLKPLYEMDMIQEVEVEGDHRKHVVCDLEMWEMILRLNKGISGVVFARVKVIQKCVNLSKSQGDDRQLKQFTEMMELYELGVVAYRFIDKLSAQRIKQLVQIQAAWLQVIDTKHSWWPGKR